MNPPIMGSYLTIIERISEFFDHLISEKVAQLNKIEIPIISTTDIENPNYEFHLSTSHGLTIYVTKSMITDITQSLCGAEIIFAVPEKEISAIEKSVASQLLSDLAEALRHHLAPIQIFNATFGLSHSKGHFRIVQTSPRALLAVSCPPRLETSPQIQLEGPIEHLESLAGRLSLSQKIVQLSHNLNSLSDQTFCNLLRLETPAVAAIMFMHSSDLRQKNILELLPESLHLPITSALRDVKKYRQSPLVLTAMVIHTTPPLFDVEGISKTLLRKI
jgi:hypothetical protein